MATSDRMCAVRSAGMKVLVIRRIPGYSWVHVGVTAETKFQWNEPLYRGIVRRFQLGPLVMLTLPKSDRQWDRAEANA